MSVDSNNRFKQIFYCPSAGIPPQVQRPVPRQQSYNLESKSAVSSTSSPAPSPSSSSSSPTSSPPQPQTQPYPSPPPLMLIKQLPTRTILPPQAPNSVPQTTSSGSVKMLDITITRKRLKVTSGSGDLPISILKPIASSLRTVTGKIGKCGNIFVPPMPQVRPILVRPPPVSNYPCPTQLPTQTTPSPTTIETGTLTPPTQESNVSSTVSPSTQPLSIQTSTLTTTQISTQPSTSLSINCQSPETPEIIERCAYCDIYFYTYNTLTLHLLTQHYATPVSAVKTCKICKTLYPDYIDFATHCLNIHSSIPLSSQSENLTSPTNPLIRNCKICNLTFSNGQEIVDHFAASHSGTTTAYKCRFCKQHVNDLWPLVVHLKTVHFVKFKYPQKHRTAQSPPETAQLLSTTNTTTTTSNSSVPPAPGTTTATNGSQSVTSMSH